MRPNFYILKFDINIVGLLNHICRIKSANGKKNFQRHIAVFRFNNPDSAQVCANPFSNDLDTWPIGRGREYRGCARQVSS